MTVNDASLSESGSKLSKVAATSLLMGVTRGSSEAYTSSDAYTENKKIGPETRADDIKNDEFDRKNTGESAG